MEVLARCGVGPVYKTDLRLGTRLAHNLDYTVEDLQVQLEVEANLQCWSMDSASTRAWHISLFSFVATGLLSIIPYVFLQNHELDQPC